MNELIISPELSLPINATTSKLAFFGGNGAGKSYAAMKLAEQMWDAGAQFVAFDPVGIWYGLRIGADGKSPGIPIIVFGGLHGDIPIGPHDGKTIADVIAGESISAVIDVSQFESDGQKGLFASDFAERFFFLKKSSPSAVHLFLEEAQEFAPEQPAGGPASKETLMANRFQRIWKIGRNYGIAGSLISQRPQEISKKAVNLSECIFTFRLTGPHERDYMAKWLAGHGETGLGAKLPSLKLGEPYVWSPAWLEFTGFVQIGTKRTFDVSATPEVGKTISARVLAPVAIDALRERLAAVTAEESESGVLNLKARIKELENALKGSPRGEALESENMRLVRTLDQVQAEIATYKIFAHAVVGHIDELGKLAANFGHEIGVLDSSGKPFEQYAVEPVRTESYAIPAPPTESVTYQVPERPSPKKPQPILAAPKREGITSTQQRILNAIAWYESIGVPNPLNVQIGMIALIDSSGGHFSNVVGPLSSAGLVERFGGRMRLTRTGQQVALAPDRVPTLAEYHNILRSRVLKAKSASKRTVDILSAVIAQRGASITTQELGAVVGIDHTGGHFSNTIGPLSTLGLIERDKGMVSPTQLLFPEGLH